MHSARSCTVLLWHRRHARAGSTLARMGWHAIFAELGCSVASRAELLSAGASGKSLTAAVRFGHLIRARRDHYLLPGIDSHVVQAVRVGGRLGCVSALSAHGVFAFDTSATHIHLEREASRLRSPRRRDRPLTTRNRFGAMLHWSHCDPALASESCVGLVDALVQAALCQHPWHALASIDNALYLKLIDYEHVADIFARLPSNLQYLRPLIDGRSESGQETVLRCIVREAGLAFEIQVTFENVGRVDMVVERRLVVEADSKLAHEGWEQQVSDRTRDFELARQGMMSLRLLYELIMYRQKAVVEAITELLDAGA